MKHTIVFPIAPWILVGSIVFLIWFVVGPWGFRESPFPETPTVGLGGPPGGPRSSRGLGPNSLNAILFAGTFEAAKFLRRRHIDLKASQSPSTSGP